jgi:hypothetical protein
MMFANAAEYTRRYPDEEGPRWAFCAPRLDGDSPELAAIRERMVKRATALGYRLSHDPEPRLIVDGKVLRPRSPSRLVHRFDIPAGAREMWLISLSTVPAYVAASSRDIRRLGLPVECLALLDGECVSETWPADLALSEGFHQNEDTHCWTNGQARVPQLRPLPRRCTLEVRLTATDLRYPKSLPKTRDFASTSSPLSTVSIRRMQSA